MRKKEVGLLIFISLFSCISSRKRQAGFGNGAIAIAAPGGSVGIIDSSSFGGKGNAIGGQGTANGFGMGPTGVVYSYASGGSAVANAGNSNAGIGSGGFAKGGDAGFLSMSGPINGKFVNGGNSMSGKGGKMNSMGLTAVGGDAIAIGGDGMATSGGKGQGGFAMAEGGKVELTSGFGGNAFGGNGGTVIKTRKHQKKHRHHRHNN